MRCSRRGAKLPAVKEDDPNHKAAQRAKDSLQRGVADIFRAAESAATAVRNEAKKTFESPRKSGFTSQISSAPTALGKAVDDAGREVVRAAAEVATFLGAGLTSLGKRAEGVLNNEPAHNTAEEGAVQAGSKDGDDSWPRSREEYERKYGKDGEDWPRSREEYERKYGRPPRKRGDDEDPGFRIA